MSTPPRVPGSFRYFKAKLWSLSRPTVWMPALVLTLMGAFVLEYLYQPETTTAEADTAGETATALDAGANDSNAELRDSLTDEELRQAAELDNLDVLAALLAEDETALARIVLPNPNGDNRGNDRNANVSPSAGDRFLADRQTQDAGTPANVVTPAAPLNLDLLPTVDPGSLGSSGLATNPTDRLGSGQFVPGGTSNVNPYAPGGSALQQGIDRLNAPTTMEPATSAASNQTGTATTGSATGTSSNPASNPALTGQSSNSTQAPLPSFVPTAPNMSPPPGTTGYTQPAALNVGTPATGTAPGNAYTNLVPVPQSGSAVGQTGRTSAIAPPSQFNGASSFTGGTTVGQPNSFTAPSVAPPPFSVPRQAPGRYTGNGEFNTFSNP